MNEKDALMSKIKSIDFVLMELHLFLDTHPNDADALAMYEKYSKKRAILVAEYEQKFGMLSMKSMTADKHWQWVSDPWPWDYTKEADSHVGL